MKQVKGRTLLFPVETEASSSPPVDVAMKLTKLAAKPLQTLSAVYWMKPKTIKNHYKC
jgi:hypothetical protein